MQLYHSERAGQAFGYEIEVLNGVYEVKLRMAEIVSMNGVRSRH